MTKLENQTLWRSRIEEQLLSELTQSAWCKQNNINYQSFQYWKKRLKQIVSDGESGSVQFISLAPMKQTVGGNVAITIGRIKLEWHDGIKSSELDQILQVLSRYA